MSSNVRAIMTVDRFGICSFIMHLSADKYSIIIRSQSRALYSADSHQRETRTTDDDVIVYLACDYVECDVCRGASLTHLIHLTVPPVDCSSYSHPSLCLCFCLSVCLSVLQFLHGLYVSLALI